MMGARVGVVIMKALVSITMIGHGGGWEGISERYCSGEGRVESVVFKFRACPFLCTVNITLSPTDL
jgi:hypothetical protein